MDSKTSRDLDAAFSLLPEKRAREAKEELLEAARGDGFRRRLQLKWSEHDLDGGFRRGGVTEMIGQSTVLVTNSQEDPDIAELAKLARRSDTQAGQLTLLSEGDRFAWFLPFSPARHEQVPPTLLRGLLVTEPVFREIVERMNPSASLTPAERRIVFQIVAGLTPREAADQDGISFETKRAHIKSATAKLHCAGQIELVRKLLGQLVHLLSISEGEAALADPAETYVSRWFGDDVRMMVRRLSSGRVIRLIECGPVDGRPVVMVHGMMFPISMVGLSRHLEAQRIRLIMPVRPGFLESRPAAELATRNDLVPATVSDLAAFLAEAEEPVPVLGQSLGGVVALRFANRYPHLVSHLILQSINLTRGERDGGGLAGRFYAGLKRLTSKPDLFKLVNWQFQKYYADRDTGREILARLFANSPPDMAVLDGEVTGTEAYAMFSELYASSVFGMSADFDFVMNAWQSEARAIGKPITIIHGERDPLTRIGELRAFVQPGTADRLVAIDGGGHFIGVSHPKETWGAVRAALDRA